MKKISYILQFNAFIDKRFDDELSPAASLLYMIIFSEFNRLHWRDEWIYISSRMLTLQMGNHSNSTISRNLKKLVDFGYIEIRLSKRYGKTCTQIRLIPLYQEYYGTLAKECITSVEYVEQFPAWGTESLLEHSLN